MQNRKFIVNTICQFISLLYLEKISPQWECIITNHTEILSQFYVVKCDKCDLISSRHHYAAYFTIIAVIIEFTNQLFYGKMYWDPCDIRGSIIKSVVMTYESYDLWTSKHFTHKNFNLVIRVRV